ncbi:MAG: hypothetical protein QOJ91_1098 [Sphingomonadales bacterium]|jgi:hypothetical protein|nr:hypothetical protein [Sphingomonadales bacterium]
MSLMRFAFVAAAALTLSSCILSPGKFVSTLHIAKDRTFTFTYVGEVILLDPGSEMTKGMADGLNKAGEGDEGGMVDIDSNLGDAADDLGYNVADPSEPAPPPAAESAQSVAEAKAVAEALSKEVGYRSVQYLGHNKFQVDYSMTGKLDRSFIYPINMDAKSIIPWIAVEVRKDRTVRVMAIAFGEQDMGMGKAASAAKPDSQPRERSGTFTFTTDAELVMQNNEEGMAPGPGTRVVWKVTPATKTVPTAVVRFPS